MVLLHLCGMKKEPVSMFFVCFEVVFLPTEFQSLFKSGWKEVTMSFRTSKKTPPPVLCFFRYAV